MEENKIKQANFRIQEKDAEAFRKFCEENGVNQAIGFNSIIQIMETDRAKSIMPGRATEIEHFEKLTKDILAAYINSLEINNTSEERIKEQFISSINSKDKTIADLQEKVAILKDEKESAEKTAIASSTAAAQAIKDWEAAQKQADTCTQLIEEKDKNISNLVAKLEKAEEKSAAYDDLSSKKNKLEAEMKQLQTEMKDLRIEMERTISDLKKDAARELSDAKKDAELALEKAVSAKEAEMKDLRIEMDHTILDLKKDAARELSEAKKDAARELSDTKKDAELALEKAVSAKEKAMLAQIRTLEKENAKLLAKIEILEEQEKAEEKQEEEQ